jgi:3-methyladenine DNA glycosylase AlkC
MNSQIFNRRGAQRKEDIPAEVLELLNLGELETVNTMERLAVDHPKLIQTAFPEMNFSAEQIADLTDRIRAQQNPSTMNTVKLMGQMPYEIFPEKPAFDAVLKKLSAHSSDTIRSYATMLIASNEILSLQEKLNTSLPLIADSHFGVREVVWIALRPSVAKELESAIHILSGWTASGDENIRRFASEVTRPRGVWCRHITRLKEQPEIALSVLEPLKADPSTYVQLSVGNWLNDASKSRPAFVKEICDKWAEESGSKATGKIIRRAKRTLNKQ